ncbi:MAG TPA: metalloregulator ArsR/SmtB family transcription factor [Candidatus Saccharimonadales bacterium]|nr:metalloregulator ArsR/SmtB family transcription factor [Candidatus Saccharimonadales bacterium]
MYEKLFGLQEEIFKTIASQKRLELIQLLQGRELSVSEMTTMLGIRQANISQHLAELRQARIVSTRREGVKIYYRLTDERIAQACTLIKIFLQTQYKVDPTVLELMQDDRTVFPILKDPVCGMRISLHHAGASSTYNNEPYYFCASGCKQKFDTNPAKFSNKKELVHG